MPHDYCPHCGGYLPARSAVHVEEMHVVSKDADPDKVASVVVDAVGWLGRTGRAEL